MDRPAAAVVVLDLLTCCGSCCFKLNMKGSYKVVERGAVVSVMLLELQVDVELEYLNAGVEGSCNCCCCCCDVRVCEKGHCSFKVQ